MRRTMFLPLLGMLAGSSAADPGPGGDARLVPLPPPDGSAELDLGEALRQRRSVREFSEDSLTLEEISELLWAAQGVTGTKGQRTATSAGALYPLEIRVVVGRVSGLSEAVHRYRPHAHELAPGASGDRRKRLAVAALDQEWVANAAAILVISAVYERTTGKYGGRGERYVHMEVGHAAQNVLLRAASLRLGAVMVGAFDDARVARVLELPAEERALAIIPVGR